MAQPGTLYKLTFKNGKSYIGITSQPFEKRWRQHIVKSKTVDYPVYRAWRKYGDPKPEILAEGNDDSIEQLETNEILNHKTLIPDGYNVVIYGNRPMLGRNHSKKTRIKISKGHLGEKNGNYGKARSEETRQKISESQKGERGNNFGKPIPKEIKKKIAKALSGANNYQSRPVLDTKTGEVFDCIVSASKNCGIKRTTLSSWLNGISVPQNEAPDRFRYVRG
ncbi:MAG: NUMOD3 domain-containing DNA-binding protein [Bacteroidales bacterium]|jgi:group I intron endonuclease